MDQKITPKAPAFRIRAIFLLLVFLHLGIFFLIAQNKTDSLLNLLQTEKQGTDYVRQVDLLNKIGLSLSFDYPDSAFSYYNIAIEISTQNKLEKEKAITQNHIGG